MKFFKFLPLLVLALFTLAVFRPFFFEGRLPIPADTIVGLYHPWRDLYAGQFQSGIPFKNFLITDPVRQQYVWRELGTKWNPYSLAGTPLLANIQAAHFYPLNLVYLFLPFDLGWSLQVVLQIILGGIFMWLYLRNLKLHPYAQALGTLAWVGSGFFVAWLEWNTLVQVAIFLPLALLAIDKQWWLVFIAALVSSFFAGHLQIFLYVLILTLAYAVFNRRISFPLVLGLATAFLITSIQWWPMLTLFSQGLRATGVTPEWFLPWQNLAQFVAPDFFGNPATLNYFGIWNYGEFVGYVGIVPLLFALFAMNKKNIFWVAVLGLSLLFSLPNFISQLPPQIVQPTRLMVLIDFSLAMLAALGLDAYLAGKKRLRFPAIFLFSVLALLWIISWKFNLSVSQKNLILPTAILLAAVAALKTRKIAIIILLALTIFDLARFAIKFESFSQPEWLYPETQITKFLEEKAKSEVFRVAALDDRIFPPNFSTHYKIQMVSGYDSIFLRNFAQFISPSANFNRIIVPKDPTLFNFLNVKYILSFDDLNNPDYQLVLTEGQTKVYENKKVLPRVSLVGGEAVIKKYSPDEVVIETSATSAGFLILRDSLYPDWKAKIDDKPVAIHPAEGIFRGVIVPGGTHTLRFFL